MAQLQLRALLQAPYNLFVKCMNKKVFLVCATFFLVVVVGISLYRKVPCVTPVVCTPVTVGSTPLRVALQITPDEQEHGLSYSWHLPERAGMLFVFGESEQYSFWMKDMNYPIDMIWISEDKQIVAISENATPESYPAKFTPPIPVKYVLEVRAGWAARHDIKIGDVVSWDKTKF